MIVLLAPSFIAIARERARARLIVQDLTATPSLRETAWDALAGQSRDPKARRPQPNHGAPCAQPGWHLLAEVIEYAHPRAVDPGEAAGADTGGDAA